MTMAEVKNELSDAFKYFAPWGQRKADQEEELARQKQLEEERLEAERLAAEKIKKGEDVDVQNVDSDNSFHERMDEHLTKGAKKAEDLESKRQSFYATTPQNKSLTFNFSDKLLDRDEVQRHDNKIDEDDDDDDSDDGADFYEKIQNPHTSVQKAVEFQAK